MCKGEGPGRARPLAYRTMVGVSVQLQFSAPGIVNDLWSADTENGAPFGSIAAGIARIVGSPGPTDTIFSSVPPGTVRMLQLAG